MLFYRLLLSVIIMLEVCSNCCALAKTDPRVDGNFNHRYLFQWLCLAVSILLDVYKTSYCTGLIRKYWFQYKRIAVILAYLHIVHHVSVG